MNRFLFKMDHINDIADRSVINVSREGDARDLCNETVLKAVMGSAGIALMMRHGLSREELVSVLDTQLSLRELGMSEKQSLEDLPKPEIKNIRSKTQSAYLRSLGDDHWMKRPEVKEKISGAKNPMYGVTGADHPSSKPVIEIVEGKFYESFTDATREAGVHYQSIRRNIARNKKRLLVGKPIVPVNCPLTADGEVNPNHGKCWIDYETFLSELEAGRSVEVHSKI